MTQDYKVIDFCVWLINYNFMKLKTPEIIYLNIHFEVSLKSGSLYAIKNNQLTVMLLWHGKVAN